MLDFTFASHQEICLDLGNRLRALRLNLGLTQTEIAARAGVSKGTVSNIEKNGQGTLESLVRVVQALGAVKELQPLFQPKPTSIDQLARSSQTRKRVYAKRKP